MSNIPTLSPPQQDALGRFVHWLAAPPHVREPVFRLYGYAGTGKTTLLCTVACIGLAGDIPCVRSIVITAPTNKAARVLNRKGVPAMTLHAALYRVITPDECEIARLLDDIAIARHEGHDVMALRRQLAILRCPRFVLDWEGAAARADLVVVDESSMIGERLFKDLLLLGKPILLVGDPGQLPPVRDRSVLLGHRPDVMLSEVHRQALDNPIIRLSMMVRQERRWPTPGWFGDTVKIVCRMPLPEVLNRADQVIVGRHVTRRMLNNVMRRAQGYTTPYPAPGEKLISLQNHHNLGLLNGTMLTLDAVDTGMLPGIEPDWLGIEAFGHLGSIEGEPVKRDDETDHEEPIRLDDREFLWHHYADSREPPDSHPEGDGAVLLTCGHAVTCHKAQGSEWPNVCVVDEPVGSGPDRWRWAYTSVTRASEKLLVVREG